MSREVVVKKWLRRVRAVVGMGLIWAVGGLFLGGLIELVDNVLPAAHPFTRLVDMWPQSLAILAFPHGVVFAVILGIVGSRRRFEELSLSSFAAWGAAAGLVFGVVELALGAPVAFIGVTTLLSAIGGASSLVLARTAERRGLLGAGADAADAGLTDGETRQLLGP